MRSAGRSIGIVGILAVLALLLAGSSGCSLLMLGNLDGAAGASDPEGGHEAILYSGAQLTLAWDPPPSPVDAYRLYYRIHGAAAWALLDELPASAQPECTIEHAVLGDGEFDFGVVAVDEDEGDSPMHTSLDDTAQPECGWYLRWAS